ncbi:MAG: GreA/GreB family elongation factor [Planctomycetota bacterium]
MSLPLLVTKERWQEFDEAWTALRLAQGPIEELLVAIELAGTKKRAPRLVPMAKDHAAELVAADRAACAARLLGAVLIAGGNPPELVNELMDAVDAGFSSEPWFETFRNVSGLTRGAADMRGPWRIYARLIALKPGSTFFHAGGWGAGDVEGVDHALGVLKVAFPNGRKDAVPLHAAVEIFEPLPARDLRARAMKNPDALRKEVKEDPLDALEAVLDRYHGEANTTKIKNALMQIGVEGSAWSAWWRKARKLAENSDSLEVSGTPTKSIISKLLERKDPAEALRRQFRRSLGLAEAHARARDLFMGSNVEESLINVALEELEAAAAVESAPLQERVAAWFLLRERTGAMPEVGVNVLREVATAPLPADTSQPAEIWRLFQALPGAKDQERSVDMFPDLFGEDAWIEFALDNLQHAAPGQVRALLDRLGRADQDPKLRTHYAGLLARPLRNPTLLVALATRFEDAQIEEGLPTPVQRAQALVTVAQHLAVQRRGDPQLTRVSARLTEFLTKKPNPLLGRLLKSVDVPTMRSITITASRGVDTEIDSLLTDIALSLDPQFFAHDTGRFWEGTSIWTTRAGLERRSAELRELREVKIPANQDAIGRAASFGDLSENSEWEAAIEEQRNLTARAMEIEEELRKTDLIEEAPVPENTVCPGTRVQYRESVSREVNTILILGPWDADEVLGTQVVSYRAPLAKGLLGLTPGKKATVKLPSGELGVEVISVEAPDLSKISNAALSSAR